MPDVAAAADSAERWREVRAVLTANRRELSRVAASLYPNLPRVGATDLLCREEWLPGAPFELDELRLDWDDHAPEPAFDLAGRVSAHVRPARPGGASGDGAGTGRAGGCPDLGRYASYADAVGALDRPGLFENRPCYRLLGARLAGAPVLRLTRTSYFDGMELGHSVAHELAAAWARAASAADGAAPGGPDPSSPAPGSPALGSPSPGSPAPGSPAPGSAGLSLDALPLRALAGDPCALDHRRALAAVTTLTLRRPPNGAASFVLHWRDPAKVNHAGGMYQVMPVGLFQPATGAARAVPHDLDVWRCMAREFSEEFLGTSEDYQDYLTGDGVLDYDRWPFYNRLTRARRAGRLRVYCLGAGVDPVTFATDILTVAVFDAAEFDAAFGGLVARNDEGRVITGADRMGADSASAGPASTGPASTGPASAGPASARAVAGGRAVAGRQAGGIPFTEDTVARLAGGDAPMQASGAALLQLAWRHRRHLLS